MKELDLGVVLDLLRPRRRRLVLDALDEDGIETYSGVVEYVAREEFGMGYSPDERKRVYVALYQTHLPKLDDYGVVEFEGTGDEGGIYKAENYEQVRGKLDAVRDDVEDEWLEISETGPVHSLVSNVFGSVGR